MRPFPAHGPVPGSPVPPWLTAKSWNIPKLWPSSWECTYWFEWDLITENITKKVHSNSKNIHLIPDTYKGRLDCSFIFFINVGVRTLTWDAELAHRCKAKIFSTSHGSEPWKCCGLYSGSFCCLTCIIIVLISTPSFAFFKYMFSQYLKWVNLIFTLNRYLFLAKIISRRMLKYLH